MLGRGDDAWRYYTKILPSYVEEQNQQLHRVEPYVCCQRLAGKDSSQPGEGKNSWLTGTAAWMWHAATEHILGIKPDFNGIRIDPCLPKTMHEYTIRRKFRGATYTIHLHNQSGRTKGINRIEVDGKPIVGNLVLFEKGTHDVEVFM